jgi:hypothetical protein
LSYSKSTRVVMEANWAHDWLGFYPEPRDGEQRPDEGGYSTLFEVTGLHDLQYSESNPAFRKGIREGWDVGGAFRVVKHHYEQSTNCPEYLTSPSGTYRWRGPQRAVAVKVIPENFPLSIAATGFELDAFGTTAIARVLPTNPVAGLATYIGEMKDGIPSLVGADFFKSRARKARSAGSEYLNVEFGWRPLVSDLQKFGFAVKNSDRLLNQFANSSGKKIKRHYKLEFPDEVEVQETTGFPSPTLVGPIYTAAEGPLSIITTRKRKRWFEGCFTYYVPPLSKGWRNKGWLSRASYLSGGRFSPETLWDIAPWSWGADWFANVGDVFHNVNAFSHDGLVMRYGFVMETSSTRITYILRGIGYGNVPYPCDFVQTFETVTKVRRQATPIGFGLNPLIDFSNRQLAIVSALGLSRGTR